MSIEEKIKEAEQRLALLKHYNEGGEIEMQSMSDARIWRTVNPSFNFEKYNYRIKPSPKSLEDRIKAEYPGYEVVSVRDEPILEFESPYDYKVYFLHVAQSMKGFYTYVYLDNNDAITESHSPLIELGYGVIHPVACLFERGEE